MINAEISARALALVEQLRRKAEQVALGRAQKTSPRDQPNSHPWRRPERLWPDIFKEP
ncbi:MAG: hypothetical protein QNI87_13300 [Erythrobacter sp.]|uniref:hypothetical protein n=1 Tax=Erythrobacter sp. TaxID=1042 RepID=UPI002601A32E|nr:hypothetical protein [Erythrobacter sp.]MDJ0979497.1 hypothetical protein [Erythrobacter sp.]